MKWHAILCNKVESAEELLSSKVKEHPTTGYAIGFYS